MLAGQAGRWTQPPPQHLAMRSAERPGSDRPLRLGEGGDSPSKWLRPLAQSGPAEVAVPLAVAGRKVGLLALGKRWDEEIFDERDMEIVALIGQQAALFLLAAVQVEELRQVPRRVAEAQERERHKIAQELHDTVQQFLGRLPFYLEVSRSSLWEEPIEAARLLERSIADVERAASTVREIRSNLAPSQLEAGLAQPLKELVGRFERRTAIPATLTVPPGLDGRISLEARHALYRVVQQALDNVTAHADAHQVQVQLTGGDDRVTFMIADDGRGSSEQERQQAQAGGSFGLESMQARIHAAGGELELHSSPGQGTQVKGWLPLDEEA